MATTKQVQLGWEDDAGAAYVVRAEVRFGTPKPEGLYPGCGSRWAPGDEDDAVKVLSVTEDRPGGAECEDLVDVVQAELDQGGRLRERALEDASDDGPEPDEDDARDFAADEAVNLSRESEV